MSPPAGLTRPRGRTGAAYRPRTRVGIAAALALALAGVALPSPAAADEGRTLMLADFEAPDAVKGAVLTDPVLDRAEADADLVAQGRKALRFSAAPWNDARGGTWPGVRFDAGGALPKTSWQGYGYLTLDVANPYARATQVSVIVTDAQQRSYTMTRELRAHGYTAIDVPLADVAKAGVDLASVASIRIDPSKYPNPWRAPWPVRVVLDNIRLTEKPPQHDAATSAVTRPLRTAMRLGSRADAALARLRSMEKRIPGGDAAPDRYLRERAGAFRDELKALRKDAVDPGLPLAEAWRVSDGLEGADRELGRFGDRVAARAARPGGDFGVATADSMRLAYPRDLRCECAFTGRPKLGLARGEYENLQLLALPYQADLSGVQARVTGVKGPDGRPAGSAITTRVDPVGSLYTKDNGLYHTRPGTVRPADYEGWVPDPIMTHLDAVDVKRDDVQPFWFEARAAKDAAPGVYEATVEVTAAGLRPQNITVRLDVWKFALPERPKLPTAMTFTVDSPAKVYGVTDPEGRKRIWRQHVEFLERFKIEPDNLYGRTPVPAADAKELKDTYGLRNFNIFYLDPRAFDPNDPGSWQPEIDEYLSQIGNALEEYKAAGVDEHAYVYGFDESNQAYWPAAKELLTQIKRKFPGLRTMTTLRDPTMGEQSGLADLIDIWVPDLSRYDHDRALKTRARGKQVWWYNYVSIRHPMPNWFNGYPPSDTRVYAGAMAHKYGIDGMLYYRVERWTDHKPLTDGPFSSWDPVTWSTVVNGTVYGANGDGSLYYPGPDGPLPSIRIQNFRDGMEDYNLLEELRTQVESHPGDPARALLDVPDHIVKDLTNYTEDADAYRAWREKVAAAIERLSRG